MFDVSTESADRVGNRGESDSTRAGLRHEGDGDTICLDALMYGEYVHVTGRLPCVSDAGNSVEYRVLLGVGERADAADEWLSWRIVGGGSEDDRALLASTRVGRFEQRVPFHSLDVVVGADDVDEFGWLDVRAATCRRFASDALSSASDIDRLRWIPDGALMTIDISGLARSTNCVRVRLGVREVVGQLSKRTKSMPGDGATVSVRIDR